MAAAGDVEGRIAVASVVAVEEAVLLLSVEGIVGGVEVENELIGGWGRTFRSFSCLWKTNRVPRACIRGKMGTGLFSTG